MLGTQTDQIKIGRIWHPFIHQIKPLAYLWCVLKRTCILSLFLIIRALSWGQYTITHYDETDGLFAPTVYDINQDNDGLIWLATSAGIYKYDGVNFRNFGIQDGLTELENFQTCISPSGYNLFYNFSGTFDFIYQDKIYPRFNGLGLPRLKPNEIGIGDVLEQDKFVISNRKSNFFYIVKIDENARVSIVEEVKLGDGEVLTSLRTLGNNIAAFYQYKKEPTRLRIYSTNGEPLRNFTSQLLTTPHMSNSLDDGVFLSILNSDTLPLLRYLRVNSTGDIALGKKIDLPEGIKSILQVDSNNVWVTLMSGGVMNIKDGQRTTYLEKMSCNDVFQDIDGQIWIGTFGSGLFLLEDYGLKNFSLSELEISDNILALEAGTDGSIFLGYDKLALGVLNKDQVKNISLNVEADNRAHRVMDLELSSMSTILCGTDIGLIKLDLKTLDKETIIQFPIKYISSDGSKKYIGSSNRLHELDEKNEISNAYWENRSLSIRANNQGDLMIATIKGLWQFKNNTYQQVKGFENRRISDIQIQDDQYYMASDSGLIFYKNGSIHYVTEKEGLLSNHCSKLYIDKTSVWVGTNKGLCQVPIDQSAQTKQIRNFTSHCGLASNKVNDVLIHDGLVYVATNKGLSIFNPRKVKTAKCLRTFIVDFNNQDSSFNLYKPVSFLYNTRDVSITFSGASFGHKLDYYYKLQPSESDWQKAPGKSINFNSLHPGNYTFQVKATDPLGNESTVRKFDFEVRPLIRQSRWFQIAMFLLFMFITYLLIRWNNRRLQQKTIQEKEIENRMNQLELEAIKAQIKPHFIYNCLNSIQNTIISKRNEDAEKQLGVFSNLIRETFEFSKLDFITLANEIEYLKKYLQMQKLRFKDKLEYDIKLVNIEAPSAIKLPTMLIQPFLENALVHGLKSNIEPEAKVLLRFKSEDDFLVCEIEDFGDGIQSYPNENRVQRLSGSQITNQRAETYNKIHNLKIEINLINKASLEADSHGTIARISIPKHENSHI